MYRYYSCKSNYLLCVILTVLFFLVASLEITSFNTDTVDILSVLNTASRSLYKMKQETLKI